MKTKKNMNKVVARLCVMLAACLIIGSAHATIIAYDGFADGGLADGHAPGATAYTTTPFSTDGLTNDSLHAQSPVSTGFADADAWFVTNSVVSSNLYYQARIGGLVYPNFAPMTNGQARMVNSSNTSSSKIATRDAVTTDTSDIQWVAMLVNFSSAPSNTTWYSDFVVTLEYGEPGYPDGGDGAWTPALFGVYRDSGKAFYKTATGGSKVDVETDSALSAGTHLFLMKFDDRPGASGNARYDDVTFWVDPVLTEDPNSLTGGLAAVSIMRSDLAGVMHPFDNIKISGCPKTGNQIAFDEFIITDDYADLYTTEARHSASFQTVDATYIRSRSDYDDYNKNFNDNSQLIIGPTTGDKLRALIEFDVSSIPSADQVDSVLFFLTTYSYGEGINDVGAPGDISTFNVYNYAYDIDETTATWNAPDVNTNDVPGGTFGTLLSSASVNVEKRGLRMSFSDTVAFRDAVEEALDGDGILRLIVSGADETVGTHNFARFSDETQQIDFRPQLIVRHQYIPPTGTIILIH